MSDCPVVDWNFFGNTLYWPCRFGFFFGGSFEARCKLWVAFARGSCKWGLSFFYLFIFSCWAGNLLWFLYFCSYLEYWCVVVVIGYGYCFCWVCFAVGSNVFLSGNGNYKSFVGCPLCGSNVGGVGVGGVRCG